MSDTTLINIDPEILQNLVQETETNVDIFTQISDSIVQKYTKDFDDLMYDMKSDLVQNDATDKELEKYLFELGNMLYFLGSKLEDVGIRDDISKLAAKEAFNNAYLANRIKDAENRNKTTVAELTAMSEDASRYETVLNSLYSRVYKQIKFKMDAGYDMVNSIRKIITKRMQDSSLNVSGYNLNIMKEMVSE